jgi:hypothetical protein
MTLRQRLQLLGVLQRIFDGISLNSQTVSASVSNW